MSHPQWTAKERFPADRSHCATLMIQDARLFRTFLHQILLITARPMTRLSSGASLCLCTGGNIGLVEYLPTCDVTAPQSDLNGCVIFVHVFAVNGYLALPVSPATESGPSSLASHARPLELLSCHSARELSAPRCSPSQKVKNKRKLNTETLCLRACVRIATN